MNLEFAIHVITTLLIFKPATSQTCKVADWWDSLDRQGWSVCPKMNTYLRGFMRSGRLLGDERVGRLEEGRCCEADEPIYAIQPAACSNANWSSTLDGFNVWALCPTGYYLNGLRLGRGLPAFLSDIEEGKCCRPQNHPNSYEDCYDEDVSNSFNERGWSECQRAGYYMTGFYKSNCNDLNCIDKFRCCKMKKGAVNGGWSDFGDWSECIVTCGGGIKERRRTCTSPPPANGGQCCAGDNVEAQSCNTEKEPVCPDRWVLHVDSCFLVIDIPTLEWSDARRNCQKLGGDLAKITSASENQFISDLATKEKKITDVGVWIGLHRKVDNKFYWADDTPLAGYSNWNTGEPNNVAEKCGNMYIKGSAKGKWNDSYCTRRSDSRAKNAPVVLCQKRAKH